MAEGLAWFSSQSIWTQVFFGLFIVFIALPIATLTVMQLVESVRSSREISRNYGNAQGKDQKDQ